MDSRVRGNDKSGLGTVIPAKAGIHNLLAMKRQALSQKPELDQHGRGLFEVHKKGGDYFDLVASAGFPARSQLTSGNHYRIKPPVGSGL